MLPGAAPATPSPSPALAAVWLEPMSCNRKLAAASGFIVARPADKTPFLITNGHVLSGRHPDDDRCLDRQAITPKFVKVTFRDPTDTLHAESVEFPVVDEDGIPLWHEHPEDGRTVDVVALPTGWPNLGFGLSAFGIWEDSPYPISTTMAMPLSVVGYPYGLSMDNDPIWIRGSIATDPRRNFGGLPRFLLDARTRKGQSGSMVMAYHPGFSLIPMTQGGSMAFSEDRAQFMGVYSGRTSNDSDLGYVWNADVTRFVVEHGVRPTEAL